MLAGLLESERSEGVVVVTGGTGFLGGHLVRTFLSQGIPVRALGRNLSVGLELTRRGADFRPVDLRDRAGMAAAIRGAESVVHSGALSSAWGRYRDFFDINVGGTENVIAACVEHNVERLVHISSPSVMSRHEVQRNLRETDALPDSFVSYYSETKALAELRVLEASGQGLKTVILRPKAIYGPGDQALLPRLAEALEKGRLRILGDGNTVTNITHVRDVVQACALALSSAKAVGRTYIITGDEEVNLWELVRLIADTRGYRRPTRKISMAKAMRVGAILEAVWRLLPLGGEPPLTRYKASVLGYSQTYDISAARTDLGYDPRVPWQEGVRECLAEAAASIPEPASMVGDWHGPREDGASFVAVPVRLFVAGHTKAHLRHLGYSNKWAKIRVPAIFALVEHPRFGPVLFDTGYSTGFFEATKSLPFSLYRKLTPVQIEPEQNASAQLAAAGIDPSSVALVILSHLDPDHVGGIKDFPNARFACSRRAWEHAAGRTGLAALRRRILPGLLPEDLAGRLLLLPDPDGRPVGNLGPSLDLFEDGSLRLVSLPGHAPGHLGAFVHAADGGPVLLVGDACWTLRQLGSPTPGLHRTIAHDRGEQDATYETLIRFRSARPDVRVVPSHCPDAQQAFMGGSPEKPY